MSELVRIHTPSELDALFQESNTRDVLLLKHSTRCGTSAAAFHDVRDFAAGRSDANTVFAFLEVPGDRSLSDDVTARTGVMHASPQVLVLRGGKVTWHASHWRITKEALAQALSAAPS